ncbi:CocE/NonD family hydrolase [Nocardia rhizosphaerihabitans]|uniref:CocE/NonD family hydrolase n=1 Tax=Nocardia rhizosphaerihabitans TaxID=1691570 RepID=UPI00366FFEC9
MTRALTAVAASVVALSAATVQGIADAAPGDISVTPLWFDIATGPDGAQRCTIEGDLYRPSSASAATPVPAVLSTNGFGLTKDGLAGTGAMLAEQGYAALMYSGLGFGDSTCTVGLDNPEWDGRAAQQLVSFLGGAAGIAHTDPALKNPAAAVDFIQTDQRGASGETLAHDPRVGMLGGSYGGAVQFAAAATDPRIDTIVPMITWNDLSYSLSPDGAVGPAGQGKGGTGATKSTWVTGLAAIGVLSPGVEGYLADPSRIFPCPNFSDTVCPALGISLVQGFAGVEEAEYLQSTSVADYLDEVRVPVLLMQAQHDSLFDLQEATATYHGLKQRGVEVSMIWHYRGHGGDPIPGELNELAPNRDSDYLVSRYLDWFDRHLKDAPVAPAPEFSWFRDWVSYEGNSEPAYATAPNLDAAAVLTGLPLGPGAHSVRSGPDANPEDAAAWTSEPLTSDLVQVGAPQVTLNVSGASAATAADAAVLFVTVYDLAPDGTATRVGNPVPTRVSSDTTVEVTVPGAVHRFEPGHRVQVTVAGAADGFRSGLVPREVSVAVAGLGLPVARDAN